MFREHSAYLVGAFVAVCSLWLLRPGTVYTYQVELDWTTQNEASRPDLTLIRQTFSRSLTATKVLADTDGLGLSRERIHFKPGKQKLSIWFSDRSPQKALFVVNAICREIQRDEPVLFTETNYSRLLRHHPTVDYAKWIVIVLLAGLLVGELLSSPTRSFIHTDIHLHFVDMPVSQA